MNKLKIYKDCAPGATLISNQFIDVYMKDANDAQLKIYLYLVRMLSANSSTSISDIADLFNHTEKDVLRALKYWEKNHLLSLDFDDNKNLSGIHLFELDAPGRKDSEVQSGSVDNVVTFIQKERETLPALEATGKQTEVQTVLPIELPLPVKPDYSRDDLKKFQTNDDIAQLLFIAEQYLGKPLNSNDVKTVLFFYDKLNFSSDLIDYLIQYCVEKEKKDFRYMEKVALSWHTQNITSVKQAQSQIRKYDRTVTAIMKSLGKSGIPSPKEMEFINRWTRTFVFSMDIIAEACDRTVLAVDNHRFEYADKILEKWYQLKVHHKSDIQNLDEQYQRMNNNSQKTKPANKFNQFSSTDYDFEKLETELLSN